MDIETNQQFVEHKFKDIEGTPLLVVLRASPHTADFILFGRVFGTISY